MVVAMKKVVAHNLNFELISSASLYSILLNPERPSHKQLLAATDIITTEVNASGAFRGRVPLW